MNGRSAEVTNSTRSARGTNSAVSRSCSRMMALVPGVSTMWRSRSSVDRRGRPLEARRGRPRARPRRRSAADGCCAVVGVTPSSSTRSPSSALMNALLPALNSPTTTSRKSSSSCRMELARAAESRLPSQAHGAARHAALPAIAGPRRTASPRSCRAPGIPNGHHRNVFYARPGGGDVATSHVHQTRTACRGSRRHLTCFA